MTSLPSQALTQVRTSLTKTWQNVKETIRGDLARLDRYIVFLLPLIFASFYVLPKSEQRNLIYLFCLLPMVLYLRPAVFKAVRREPVWWLIVGMCGLWVFSIAWSENLTHESIFNTIRIGVAVALFMHVCIWLAVQGKLPRERIITAVVLTAGVMGTLTLCLNLLLDLEMTTHNGRLVGFGWARHAGIGGGIYAFAGLIALVSLASARDPRRTGLLIAIVGMCAFYIALTESRGAILAFAVAATLWATLVRPKYLLALAAVFLVAGLGAHAGGFVDFEGWIDRGSAYRFGIWADALTMFAHNPVLGVGAADITPIDAGPAEFNSAHNIFIAMALDLGAVGLALFLALTALAISRAVALWWIGQGALLLTLLVFAYAVMMVHTQTVIIMPAREWLIFWLPLMLLVQECGAHRRGAGAPATSA